MIEDLLIQGALANISEVGWKQDLAIKILEKYLDDRRKNSRKTRQIWRTNKSS